MIKRLIITIIVVDINKINKCFCIIFFLSLHALTSWTFKNHQSPTNQKKVISLPLAFTLILITRIHHSMHELIIRATRVGLFNVCVFVCRVHVSLSVFLRPKPFLRYCYTNVSYLFALLYCP